MTKEDVYNKVNEYVRDGGINYPFHSIIEVLDEFFNSNVVIPKGANRHPYADVYHAIAEGITCEWKDPTGSDKWNEYVVQTGIAFRIKPSEPKYEYQWVYGQRGNSSRSVRLSEHCTIDELFTKFTDDIDVYFYMPVDETKRERR